MTVWILLAFASLSPTASTPLSSAYVLGFYNDMAECHKHRDEPTDLVGEADHIFGKTKPLIRVCVPSN